MIPGKSGRAVPCLHTLTGTGKEKIVCVAAHGFGSSKESPTTSMLLEALPARGIGVIAFDFPAHGESPVDGDALRIGNCLCDLAAAEARAKELAPEADVVYFSSSFGAYINLIYLATRPHAGRRSFLRSAAVDMPGLFSHPTAEESARLARDGYLMLDEGYTRPLKITPAFLSDLAAHNVFRLYRAGEAEVRMVHGGADETASVKDAERFARQFGAELTVIPGGDHRLSLPGMPETVLRLAEEFYLSAAR